MEVERYLFCIFNLFNFKLQHPGELRVELHKPSLKMKELWKVRDGLAKPEVQPILSGVIYFVLLQVGSFDVLFNVLVGDLECVLVVLERSPPHLFWYLSFI